MKREEGPDPRALLRRWRTFVGVLAGGLVLTLLVAFLWPPQYRSTATILIEQQEVPQDLVRSTITSFADQRVQVISQRVMTSANLLDIMRRYDLYPDDRKSKPREEVLGRMRDDIRMEMISADVIDPRSGRPTQATIAFSVAYQNRSPDLALKVANELTTLYLNENLTSRTQMARDTATFLGGEAERLRTQIAELETTLATFKEENADRLPELTPLNFQLMDRTEVELRDVDTQVRSLDQQRVYLEAQLAQINPTSQLYAESGERILSPTDRLRTMRSELARLAAIYAPDHPDVRRIEREISGLSKEVDAAPDRNDLERRRSELSGEVAAARERYAPEHPDVLRLERELRGLEASIANEVPQPTRAGTATPDNPAFIQIRAQLEDTQNQIASLGTRRAQLRGRIAEFERDLAGAPEVERAFRSLSRDYENAQLKYQEVRAKEMEATVSQNLESDRKGERFTLIEPPLPPEKPVSPNRLAVLFLGGLLALAAAVAAALGRETLDPTVRGRRDILATLDVAPLAIIPRVRTVGERVRQRRQRRFGSFGAVTAIVVAAVTLHAFYRPLDVLWFAALRRFGL